MAEVPDNFESTPTLKEIGGYLELDNFLGNYYHKSALRLHCGRAALAYLVEAKSIKVLWVPDFLCASIDEVCNDFSVELKLYSIQNDLTPTPKATDIAQGEHFYLVNYYGQLSQELISSYSDVLRDRLIVDNVMAYFEKALPKVDTLYSLRKYFGVADGGELVTTARLERVLPQDNSHEHMNFVLGRYECPAGTYFKQASANNSRFSHQGARHMSPLTENILRATPFDVIKEKREENFTVLHERLGHLNQLKVHDVPGPFMYPLLVDNGDALRSALQQHKVFVPMLWPYCKNRAGNAAKFAHNIVPLPLDQRYTKDDMNYVADLVLKLQRNL